MPITEKIVLFYYMYSISDYFMFQDAYAVNYTVGKQLELSRM
jgi:hypothetical protein